MVCTFFGHRDTPAKAERVLRAVIEDLLRRGTKVFYVGTHGAFDAMACRVLQSYEKNYDFKFFIVLSGLPGKCLSVPLLSVDTIVPEGIEKVPPRFSIAFRNDWMLRHASIVVSYVISDTASCAARYKKKAIRQGKTVLELSEMEM